jgi:Flp pilus assembly protein TadD
MIPLKKAIELAPDNAWAYYLLGEASHALKDTPGARLAWRNARRFDPYGPAGGVAAERLAGDHTAFSRVGVY